MSSICKITTTYYYYCFWGGLWGLARSCILAGATLIPLLLWNAHLAMHGLNSGSYAAAVATADLFFLFRIYPLHALHFMS